MTIEHIENTEEYKDYNTIVNEIQNSIIDYCSERDITVNDITNLSQSVFSSLLLYVRSKVFPTKDRLKVKNNINNAYDIKLCNALADFYIYLCKFYDKEITLSGYEYLTGIDSNTVYDWSSGRTQASAGGSGIYKKLSCEREKSLSDKLQTGKNPVGVLAILNHFYGWSGVGNMTEDRQKQAATLTDAGSTLFDLSESGRKELCEKQTQL